MSVSLPLDASVAHIEVVKQARELLLAFMESPAFSVSAFFHVIKDKKYEDAAGKLQHHKIRQDILDKGLSHFVPPSNARVSALKAEWAAHTITACSGDLLDVVRSQNLEAHAFAFSWNHKGSAPVLAINQFVLDKVAACSVHDHVVVLAIFFYLLHELFHRSRVYADLSKSPQVFRRVGGKGHSGEAGRLGELMLFGGKLRTLVARSNQWLPTGLVYEDDGEMLFAIPDSTVKLFTDPAWLKVATHKDIDLRGVVVTGAEFADDATTIARCSTLDAVDRDHPPEDYSPLEEARQAPVGHNPQMDTD